MNTLKTPSSPTSSNDKFFDETHAHPLETGVGAFIAGAIATTAGALAAGPVGAVVGAALGGAAGGAMGHNFGEQHEHNKKGMEILPPPTSEPLTPPPTQYASGVAPSVPMGSPVEPAGEHEFSDTRSPRAMAEPSVASSVSEKVSRVEGDRKFQDEVW